MIRYRPFCNRDTPVLAEIWRSQPASRGLAQPMSTEWFESMVLAKPYFDREGLIVAVDGETPVGFAHAAFGSGDDGKHYATQLGVVCLVMIRRGANGAEISGGLLEHAEDYLRRHGAQVLYAGGIRPLNGFYLGLYGGSELPGVLDSDKQSQELFLSHGYREIDRTHVYQHDLNEFRAPVDRRQMQLRRRTNVEAVIDPQSQNWWEACTFGGFDRIRFELTPRGGGPPLATAVFWDIEPLARSWGVAAAGLVDLEVSPEHRRQGVATYLLSESFRRLRDTNVTLVEAQAMQRNTAATGLYQELGFRLVDEAAVYRKEESSR